MEDETVPHFSTSAVNDLRGLWPDLVWCSGSVQPEFQCLSWGKRLATCARLRWEVNVV